MPRKSTLLAGGAWQQVAIDNKVIGLASGVRLDEDFGVQPVEVVGIIGRLSVDAQSYSVSLSIDKFIFRDVNAEEEVVGDRPLIPSKNQLQADGFSPDRVVSFKDVATGQLQATVRGAVIGRRSRTINANSYVTESIDLEAVNRIS